MMLTVITAAAASQLLLQPGLAVAPHRNCKAPAPPPAPPPLPPHRPSGHDPEYYANHLPLGPGVTLHANIHPLLRNTEILLQADLPPGGKPIAWLGLGVSPDGKMSAGSFMIGRAGTNAEQGCVKVSSLPVDAREGAPNGPAGFPIEDAEWAFYDGAAWLQLSRPFHDNLPGHASISATGSLHLMYAAGSTAPTSCSSKLESADYHDILHGSKTIQMGDLVHGAPSSYMNLAAPAAAEADEEDLAAPPQQPEFPREHVAHLGTSVHSELGYTTVTERIYSEPFYLRNGDLVFTAFDDTILPMPTGDYAILELVGGPMDCNNESVPLDVVYNHHWLMKPISGPTKHFNHPCPNSQDFSYVFGVGAESRRTPTVIPDGYGYHVLSGTVWGANIHLLHTEGLAGGDQGVKECIECWGGPLKPCGTNPQANGSFACCQSGRCPIARVDTVPVEYRMQMTITYTRNISMVKPVDVETYLAPDCLYEYNVDANYEEPEQKATKTWVVDHDKRFLFGVGHIHSGALNVSVFIDDVFLCASYPIYGSTPAAVGDEKGHLVEVTRCLDDGSAGGYPNHPSGSYVNHSVVVKKGARIRVDGWYWVGETDARILPTPAGAHLGVMSYFYAVFETL